MRKTMLITLMLLIIVTPSLAREMEQNSLSSVEGTYWLLVGTGSNAGDYYRFYEETVYTCAPPSEPCSSDPCQPTGLCVSSPSVELQYINFPFFALFSFGNAKGFLLTFVGIGVSFSDSGERYLLIREDDSPLAPTGLNVLPAVNITDPTDEDIYDPPEIPDPPTIDLSGTASDSDGIVEVTWSNNRGGSGTASSSGF